MPNSPPARASSGKASVMLEICFTGSRPVRRWNAASVSLSACASATSVDSLPAAGLARRRADLDRHDDARGDRKQREPALDRRLDVGALAAPATAAARHGGREPDDHDDQQWPARRRSRHSAADVLGSHAVQRRVRLGPRRRHRQADHGRQRTRGDEVSRNRRQELPSFCRKLVAGRRRGRAAARREAPGAAAGVAQEAARDERRRAVSRIRGWAGRWSCGPTARARGIRGRWGSAWSRSTGRSGARSANTSASARTTSRS